MTTMKEAPIEHNPDQTSLVEWSAEAHLEHARRGWLSALNATQERNLLMRWQADELGTQAEFLETFQGLAMFMAEHQRSSLEGLSEPQVMDASLTLLMAAAREYVPSTKESFTDFACVYLEDKLLELSFEELPDGEDEPSSAEEQIHEGQLSMAEEYVQQLEKDRKAREPFEVKSFTSLEDIGQVAQALVQALEHKLGLPLDSVVARPSKSIEKDIRRGRDLACHLLAEEAKLTLPEIIKMYPGINCSSTSISRATKAAKESQTYEESAVLDQVRHEVLGSLLSSADILAATEYIVKIESAFALTLSAKDALKYEQTCAAMLLMKKRRLRQVEISDVLGINSTSASRLFSTSKDNFGVGLSADLPRIERLLDTGEIPDLPDEGEETDYVVQGALEAEPEEKIRIRRMGGDIIPLPAAHIEQIHEVYEVVATLLQTNSGDMRWSSRESRNTTAGRLIGAYLLCEYKVASLQQISLHLNWSETRLTQELDEFKKSFDEKPHILKFIETAEEQAVSILERQRTTSASSRLY